MSDERCRCHGDDEEPWMCDCTKKKVATLERHLAEALDALEAFYFDNEDSEKAELVLKNHRRI